MDEKNISTWTPIGQDAPPPANEPTEAGIPAFATQPGTNGAPESNAIGPNMSPEQSVFSTNGQAGSVSPATWQPASTGPQGYATPQNSSGDPLNQVSDVDGGADQWVPANQPGVMPGTEAWQPSTFGGTVQAAELTATATATATATMGESAQVRHGGPFSQNAWQWSLGSVAAIIAIIVLIEIGLSNLIDRFDSGTTQRLALICVSLFTNDVVMLGVLIVVAKRMGMSFRSFGVRRPADVKESIVLGFAAWLIFILLAGVWAMVSQSAAEREANNPFLRERAVNARDSSAATSTVGSDAVTSEPTSSENSATENSATENTTNSETTNNNLESSGSGKQDSGFSENTGTGKTTNEDVADNRHALIKVLNDDPPKALLISILIAGCIGAPLLEELLVRGFLFGAFSQRFSKLAGAAISSLLFGFAHIMAYPLKMIPPLVVMGIALSWLAWQTGSIVPGMFIHTFVNSLGLGIAASLGGHIFTLMVGSWLVLAIILLPWIRGKPQAIYGIN